MNAFLTSDAAMPRSFNGQTKKSDRLVRDDVAQRRRPCFRSEKKRGKCVIYDENNPESRDDESLPRNIVETERIERIVDDNHKFLSLCQLGRTADNDRPSLLPDIMKRQAHQCVSSMNVSRSILAEETPRIWTVKRLPTWQEFSKN